MIRAGRTDRTLRQFRERQNTVALERQRDTVRDRQTKREHNAIIAAAYVSYIFLIHIILLQRIPYIVTNQLLHSFLWGGWNVFFERGGRRGTWNIFILIGITVFPEW